MPAKLFCRTGELAGTDFEIGDEATIGRGEGNAVVLPTGVVSSSHARLSFDRTARRYVLEDLRSRNGTRLDGMPVTSPVSLGPLHVITFAERHDFLFQILTAPQAPARRAPVPAREPQVQRTVTGSGVTPRGDAPTPAPATLYEPVASFRLPEGVQSPPSPPPPGSSPPPPAPAPTVYDPTGGFRIPEELARSAGRPAAATPPLPGPETAPPPAPASTVYDPTGGFKIPEDLARSAGRPAAATPPPHGPETAVAPPPPPSPRPVAGRLRLAIRDDGTQRTVDVPEGQLLLGRAPHCHVCLSNLTLSREHAVITVSGGHVTIADRGSQNGTFIGGTRITAPIELRPGVEVTLGDTTKLTLIQE